MAYFGPSYATLDDWIAHEAIPFTLDAPASLNTAVDRMIAALGDQVELLGFGEALHGGEALLQLRNRLFQRLVTTHGYSAIAIESSFPRSRAVNAYIAGRGPAAYSAIEEAGFSHNAGRLAANRELVEWMRGYNAEPAHTTKLHFYGFDSPTEPIGTDSPRAVLLVALDYLAVLDDDRNQQRRERIDALLGADADWENPAASMDPSLGIGVSAAAVALRVETEDLINELHIHRPELIARTTARQFRAALHYAALARQLLTYHAVLARPADDRIGRLLSVRDVMMADTLAYIVAQQRGRGKTLVFAHNSHLQRSQIAWQLGPHHNVWWPAGAHLDAIVGAHYVAVGSALGVSEANGIGQPELGTLEALLSERHDSCAFIPTLAGQAVPASTIAALPIRAASAKNPSYAALEPASFTNFAWLAFVDATGYMRGGPELP